MAKTIFTSRIIWQQLLSGIKRKSHIPLGEQIITIKMYYIILLIGIHDIGKTL